MPKGFAQPICCAGNDGYSCNAAIGYAKKYEVFSFPWISRIKYDFLVSQLHSVCETLEKTGCIVLLPVSSGIPLSGLDNYPNSQIFDFQ